MLLELKCNYNESNGTSIVNRLKSYRSFFWVTDTKPVACRQSKSGVRVVVQAGLEFGFPMEAFFHPG